MSLFEILWITLGITLTIATLALVGVVCALAPIGAERQRRRNKAAVDSAITRRDRRKP